MSYNLLLDTDFKNNLWKFNNCSYENGYLISSSKIFGIYQELILPDITPLYFRFNYLINDLSKDVFNIKIGIQNGSNLEITQKLPKIGKQQSISLVTDAKQEKIKVHLIFESKECINKLIIDNPILYDLKHFNKSTWLKSILDKTIKFRQGYSYQNILDYNELLLNNEIFNDSCNLEQGKIGSILNVKDVENLNIKAKFIDKHYYLIKLDFEEINEFGEIYFKYGPKVSDKFGKEQIYIIIKYNTSNDLYLNIINKYKNLNYLLNLKNLMIVDITKMKLLKEDIPYLPFV